MGNNFRVNVIRNLLDNPDSDGLDEVCVKLWEGPQDFVRTVLRLETV